MTININNEKSLTINIRDGKEGLTQEEDGWGGLFSLIQVKKRDRYELKWAKVPAGFSTNFHNYIFIIT